MGGKIRKDVGEGKDRLRAITDELLATFGIFRADAAGHGVDGAVLLKREPGGDEAAAAEGGFHDYDAERKAADDPVADGEMPGVRKRSGRVFRNEQAPLDDRPAQSVIFFGVADIGARAEHGDGPARQIEGGEMCLLVDADGEAGNHGDARGREAAGYGLRRADAFPAACPGSDDAHAGIAEQAHVPLAVEAYRRIRQVLEQRWVAAVGPEQDGSGEFPCCVPFFPGGLAPFFRAEFADQVFPQARFAPVVGAPHGLECRAERIQKAFAASGSEPVGMRKGQRRPEFGA